MKSLLFSSSFLSKHLSFYVLSLLILSVGCSTLKKDNTNDSFKNGQVTNSHEASERVAALLKNVYFEYDQYVLNEDDISILQQVAEYLKQFPELSINIEGHTDERGSTEYNLGLGEKRAINVMQYLVDLGIERSKFHAISFGEEKPVALGQTESSYKQNRRAHFAVSKPATEIR